MYLGGDILNKIIIASHGKFADGIKDAVNILIGEKAHIDFISAYTTEIKDAQFLKEKFVEIISLNKDKNIFILTDIVGGSITNTAMEVMKNYNNIHIISGMNLGLILEFINEIEDCNEPSNYFEIINQSIESAKEGIIYINQVINGGKQDDQAL